MSEPVKGLLAYLVAALLCLALLVGVLELWRADLTVPFAYSWDGLLIGAWTKGVVEHGWYLHNDALGAPAGADLHDFPMADNLHFLLIKLVACFTADYAVVFNICFLLTFPLATLSALFVLRHFQITYGPALVGSLLFTFLPYHLICVTNGQLFLASYYLVPLAVMVVLWVYLDSSSLHVRSLRCWAALGIGVLVAAAGVYYAFFACFFLLVAGAAGCVQRRRAAPLMTAAVLVAVIGLGVLLQASPTMLYKSRQGGNQDAIVRLPHEAEIYSLKIAKLLLPVTEHRVGRLAHLKSKYNNAPVTFATDNDCQALGLIGGVGFLLLIGRLLYRPPAVPQPQLADALGLLNVFAVLLGTLGGFSSLFSLLVCDWIRGYYRICVFIGFFALFAVALALDAVRHRYVDSRGRAIVCTGLLGVLLAVGVLDQTTRRFVPPYDRLKEAYAHDAEFVNRIEASVPANALIFQLPYVPFPEHPPVFGMRDYDHFRGYLHSRTLCWSYGAMKGRPPDRWARELAARPLAEQVPALTLAGFAGIYVDRAGYLDRAAGVEAELSRLLDATPLVSEDGRWSFFQLTCPGR